jgi:thymidylate synthase (FAD)
LYAPEHWRLRHENKKQGSSDETVTHWFDQQTTLLSIQDEVSTHFTGLLALYEKMIATGVAPEMARMVLPQAMFTSFVETASLAGYARLCKQRMDSHAQWETSLYACAISEVIEGICPVSWAALTADNHKQD